MFYLFTQKLQILHSCVLKTRIPKLYTKSGVEVPYQKNNSKYDCNISSNWSILKILSHIYKEIAQLILKLYFHNQQRSNEYLSEQ